MKKVTHYQINPFKQPENTVNALFFKPDNYKLNMVLTKLTPIGLRVLFYALANVKPDGSVELSPVALARTFQAGSTYVASGIRLLVKYNFLARQSRSVYWLSPALGRPMSVTHG